MLGEDSKDHRQNTRRTPSTERKASKKKVQKTVEKRVYYLHSTPTKSSSEYLYDERWDILPKTDYTYARSGSYSPRFFGREYVNPNMSRYRIRDNRGSGTYEESEDGAVMYMEYSDDDDLSSRPTGNDDSDSNYSYDTVYEDGISLRSGKNLQSMREVLHEHDERLSQTEIIHRSSRHAFTTSKLESRSRREVYNQNDNAQTKSALKKSDKTIHQNQKQFSQSERKNYRNTDLEAFEGNQSLDYGTTSVRSRRNLNTQFKINNHVSKSKQGNGSLGLNYDETDSGPSRHITRSVHRTVTHEYLDNDLVEKGNTEMSEKMSRSLSHDDRQNVSHMYGLDSEDEFSDSNTYTSSSDTRGSRYSRSGSSISTNTTIITRITESFTSITSPIISPVWNNVGRPVWTNIVQPITSLITSILYLSWLLVSRPVTYIGQSIGRFGSWLYNNGLEECGTCLASVFSWFYSKVTVLSSQQVVSDSWLYNRRRRRSCCWCLLLLLLLPLLLAFWAGSDKWSGKETLSAYFAATPCVPPVIINEKGDSTGMLSAELRALILELQAGQQKGLTAADVEATVYRIVSAETTALRGQLDGAKNQDFVDQVQWKSKQEVKLVDMQKKQDTLLAAIKDLENSLSSQRLNLQQMGADVKSDAGLHVAGLEEKLAALQLELHALQKEQSALMVMLKDCCHNKTFIGAAVTDGVNAILAQMMSGKASDHPAQEAFTGWIQSQYISREVLDQRLKDVSDDLTASLLALMKGQMKDHVQNQVKEQLSAQEASQTHAHLHVGDTATQLDEYHIKLMIEEALLKYSADKIGLADFALESAGGSVVSTKCSETLYRKTGLISLFGVPIWYTANSPRTVIQPEVLPGQCWPISGSTGYIVIKTTTIKATGFTLEHIPKALAPDGDIDSAPKDFTVLGLDSLNDENGVSLGNFSYTTDGKPVQTFPIQVSDVKPFNLYEFKILSNHGNPVYTCIYRLRIHGKVYKEN